MPQWEMAAMKHGSSRDASFGSTLAAAVNMAADQPGAAVSASLAFETVRPTDSLKIPQASAFGVEPLLELPQGLGERREACNHVICAPLPNI
jgi:hypothetical protein